MAGQIKSPDLDRAVIRVANTYHLRGVEDLRALVDLLELASMAPAPDLTEITPADAETIVSLALAGCREALKRLEDSR